MLFSHIHHTLLIVWFAKFSVFRDATYCFIEFRYVVLNHDNFVDGDFTVIPSSANSENYDAISHLGL